MSGEAEQSAPQSRGVGWGAFTAALVGVGLLLGAGGVFLSVRLDDLAQGSLRLQETAAALQGDLDEAQSRVAELEDVLTRTQADVRAVDESVKDVGESVDQQAERSLDVGSVRDHVLPSVVTVYCDGTQGSGFAIGVSDLPPGFQTAIITNHHVIDDCTAPDAPSVQVVQGEATPTARLWAWDVVNDLALVFVDQSLPHLEVASTPQIGDPVVTVGSPYDLDGTVTRGVVSNIYDVHITTDAAIGPGNSGGPLLDRYGDVLGVTTFGLEGSDGTNFAVRMRVRCEEILVCG